MKVKFHDTTNGIFISIETKELMLSLKKPCKSKEAAQKALKDMVYHLFSEPEEFLNDIKI